MTDDPEAAPRLTGWPLPAYPFAPGENPHPTRSPAGHGANVPDSPAFREPAWRENEAFCYGIDLFNAGFYWEAHEAWEGLWRRADDPTRERDLLQGLIQVAASLLKVRTGHDRSARRLAARGVDRLEAWRAIGGPTTFDVTRILEGARAIAEAPDPLDLDRHAFPIVQP